MGEDQFDDVVQRLYEAAEDPARLSQAFERFAPCLGLDGWLLLRLGDTVDVRVMAGPACDAALEPSAYQSCYESVAPLARLAIGLPAGDMLVSQLPFDDTGESVLDHRLAGGDRHEVMAWRASAQDGPPFVVCLLRGVQKGPFALPECALAGRFAQHLERVLRLQARLGSLALQSMATEAALDSTALGVLGLDESGRVRYANRRARGLADGGRLLRLVDDRLQLNDHAAHAWLVGLLSSDETPLGPVTRLLRDAEGRCPEALTLLPLSGPETGWLCLLAPLHARRLATVGQLGETFSLTPDEAHLARALATGTSLSGYAAEARIQVAAARDRLRSLLGKTGADGTSAVVRIVHAIPAVRAL